jgi:DNA invertase Pin-like site-specific DNA recombinase
MMAASAQMACDFLVERTRARLAAARRVGRIGGRNGRPGRQGVEKRLAGGE